MTFDELNWTEKSYSSDSRFYPLGEDLAPPINNNKGTTQAQITDPSVLPHEFHTAIGMISCNDIKASADWLFQDATIDVNGNISVNGVGVTTPAGGGGASGTGIPGSTTATTDQCQATGFSLNWILCGVYDMFANATDAIFTNIIQPFLYPSPISTDSSDPSFLAWSAFRVYGNIFLVIAMLVIVFGQAIGGGLIDAYTAKKVMPRILMAAIMLNLSVYIVGLMVDISNVLGKGIGQLMLAPLHGLLAFSPTPGTQASAFGVGGILLFFGGASIAGFVGAAVFGGGAFIAKAAILIALTVIVPAFLALLSVFATLVIRQGLILILIITSPVAFALYCLPNTEKYFKKWWDLLLETLLVYPIIVVIFTSATILSATTLSANKGNATPIASLVAFALQVIPLFLVPFAFKFAGSTIGKVYEAVTGGAGKVGGMLDKRKEQSKKDVSGLMLEARGRQYNKARQMEDSASNPFSRRLGRTWRKRVAGYNLEGALAEHQLEQNKIADAMIATGPESTLRSLTTRKDLVNESKGGIARMRALDAAGRVGFHEGKDWKVNDRTGALELANASGAFFTASAAQESQARWGTDTAMLQRAMAREVEKVQTQDQNDALFNSLPALKNDWGLNDTDFNEKVVGAGFATQQISRELKQTRIRDDGSLELNGKGFVGEWHSKIGTSQGLSMDAEAATTLGATYVAASQAGNGEVMQQIEEIMGQFNPSPAAGGTQGPPLAGGAPPGSGGAGGALTGAIGATTYATADAKKAIDEVQHIIDNSPTGTPASVLAAAAQTDKVGRRVVGTWDPRLRQNVRSRNETIRFDM